MTAEVKGNVTKAEQIIKSLTFASYGEKNLCDLKEGIPDNEYDATVYEIAYLTGMPEKLRKKIKRARNFTSGNISPSRSWGSRPTMVAWSLVE